ncbi:MAG: hypothetical protein JWP89_5226 [Schlesneria sp.]|nr:hypothetical protein [Schlesneria sp.]
MNWMSTIGRMLGYDNVSSIDSAHVSFGSAWAHAQPALVVFGCIGLAALSVWFYLRWQARGHRPTRLILATLRAVALCGLLLILADPTLELIFVSEPKPVLWMLLDGSDSMSIPDELPAEERDALAKAVDLAAYQKAHSREAERPARADYARAMLARKDKNLLERLEANYRLRLFTFADAEGVRSLNSGDSKKGVPTHVDWQTTGSVTALGDAFEDLARKHASDNLAAVLVISDFDQNAGTPPLAAAKKLGVPIFTVGVGPLTAIDLSVDLLAPPTMKKAESSTINVTVRQRELENTSVHVRLYAHQPGDMTGEEPARTLVGEKTVTISGSSEQVEFPYTPVATGRFIFTAEIDPAEGEVVVQNNKAEREVKIIDDFLRLMFVEYEPTWEWRFVKEVFHRDKLVGTRGFRTFIRSADPVVRETNELFLPSLTLPRSQFFENDVIFLGDMPASALTSRFCEMTKEFVSQFGGGLVVMAGPRFGPGQLAETALADMLPVVVDPDGKRRDDKEFRLALTPIATQYDFMRLGQTDQENLKGWNNMGKLPWFQPVRRLEIKGTQVLAEHPTEMCVDGKTPQPLIAVRQYGRGEVVYLAFNEMWRLRRLYGEEYYRQFWGQLIHRLGLSHALGSHKRFVVRTDKPQYRADDQVLITIEAYDKEFQPLDAKDVPDHRLVAELIRPDRDSDGNRSQVFSIPQLKPGVFETRIPVFSGGEYRLRVTDPVANEAAEINFDVANVSVERRNPVRNVSLQRNISAETNGKAYDLTDVDHFTEDFSAPRLRETSVEILPLWSTWLTFGVVITALMMEWFVRKLVNLA